MPRSSDQLWSQNLPPSPLHLLQLLLSLVLHKSTRLTAWHHWWSVSLMGSDSGEKDCDAGTEEGGEGPGWQAAYWNQTFSQQADPLLLLLLLTLSVDTRTFCPWQVQVPSFAPPPSCNQLPDARLVSFAGNLLVRGACTIPSTSFAMTSNVLCKSLNSCATKILTFLLKRSLLRKNRCIFVVKRQFFVKKIIWKQTTKKYFPPPQKNQPEKLNKRYVGGTCLTKRW